jgi:hypothetical protein
MRHLSLITLLFCSFANLAKAQSDTSAPTKEDAVAFINKVLSNYPGSLTSDIDGVTAYINYSNGSASLNGCYLTIQTDIDVAYSDNTSHHATLKNVINLSLVYLSGDKSIISNEKGAITFQRIVAQNAVPNPSSVSSIDFTRLIMNDQNGSPEFKDRNYGPRVMKALDFLIKQCGGGKMKVDASEKF